MDIVLSDKSIMSATTSRKASSSVCDSEDESSSSRWVSCSISLLEKSENIPNMKSNVGWEKAWISQKAAQFIHNYIQHCFSFKLTAYFHVYGLTFITIMCHAVEVLAYFAILCFNQPRITSFFIFIIHYSGIHIFCLSLVIVLSCLPIVTKCS